MVPAARQTLALLQALARQPVRCPPRHWPATEDCEVTPGFASVAAAVHDHAGRPAVAGLTRRITGRAPSP